MTSRTTRRRFVAIAGAVAGAALSPARGGRAAASLHHWNGVALGARASIRLLHPDPVEAGRVIDLAVQEIERLELIFSLYRADSAVTLLNRQGRLEPPPLELVEVLSRAREVSRASGGAFDVSVQPIWGRYRDHFSVATPDAGAPEVADLLPLVDWRAVRIDGAAITFERAGMAITLNGIAQGYVADQVAALLRRNGVQDVLLDLGEARALGHAPGGRAWQIGIADVADPERVRARVECTDGAVATSNGSGTVFDRDGRYGHLIDPRDGRTGSLTRAVTVSAREATVADAWSTAFALMTADETRDVAAAVGGLGVYVAETGSVARLV